MVKKILTRKNQTIYDIAAQYYGDVALFEKVLDMNPLLVSDYADARSLGVAVDEDEFDLAYPLAEGQELFVDETLISKPVLRELGGVDIISYEKNDLNGIA